MNINKLQINNTSFNHYFWVEVSHVHLPDHFKSACYGPGICYGTPMYGTRTRGRSQCVLENIPATRERKLASPYVVIAQNSIST